MQIPGPEIAEAGVGSSLKAWTQIVGAPLQAFVVVTAIWLAALSPRRERIMLAWFIAGLLAMLARRILDLARDGEPVWFIVPDEGVLPTLTSASFLVILWLWWKGRAFQK